MLCQHIYPWMYVIPAADCYIAQPGELRKDGTVAQERASLGTPRRPSRGPARPRWRELC